MLGAKSWMADVGSSRELLVVALQVVVNTVAVQRKCVSLCRLSPH